MVAVTESMGAPSHECSYGDQRVGFEFKLSSAPELTPSMRIALEDLGLQHLWVVHAGKDVIRLAPDVTALPLAHVAATKLW